MSGYPSRYNQGQKADLVSIHCSREPIGLFVCRVLILVLTLDLSNIEFLLSGYYSKSKVKKILLSPNHVKMPFYLAGAFAKASRKQNLKKTILIISDM